MKVAVGAT